MGSVVRILTSQTTLRFIAPICVLSWTIAFVIQYVSLDSRLISSKVPAGKDFLAFYGAGQLVADGQGANLYDMAAQKHIQREILAPDELDGYLYFINPAYVALPYRLLVELPYIVSFLLHTLFMFACFCLAIVLIKPTLPALGHWWTILMLTVSWFPVSHTITGGQNAALVLLLLTVTYRSQRQGQQWWAGIALGLLQFKPQYAMPMIGLLLLRRQWATVGIACAVTFTLYVLGGLHCGWNWPQRMIDSVSQQYRTEERRVSGATHVAVVEVIDYTIVQALETRGYLRLAELTRHAGHLVIFAAILGLMFLWCRRTAMEDMDVVWAVTIAALPLISLHAQYYDAAILILPILLLLNHDRSQGRNLTMWSRALLVVAFIAFPLIISARVSDTLGFQPAFLILVGILCWAVHRLRVDGGVSAHA